MLLSTLLLLLLIDVNNAKYPVTNFGEVVLTPGIFTYIYSPRFTVGNYPAGRIYHWSARHSGPIEVECNILNMPGYRNNQCYNDALIIKLSPYDLGQRYCSSSVISVNTTGNTVDITLVSTSSSSGGRFYCILKPIYVNKCMCGWKHPTRISGGEETGVNEFPMMAGLVHADGPKMPHRTVFCGATIINNKQVLTAAHCVHGKNPTRIGVLVGDHNLSQSTDTNATVLFPIINIIEHHWYDPTLGNDYDIAIINIDGYINFHQRVGPACLPFAMQTNTFAEKLVTLVGWGTYEYIGRIASALQKVNVHVISNTRCQQHYTDRTVYNGYICTFETDKDSCQYDSGGPLLWRDPVSKRLFLVGIISFGSICAGEKPTINTRLTNYLNWVEQHKPEEFEYCK